MARPTQHSRAVLGGGLVLAAAGVLVWLGRGAAPAGQAARGAAPVERVHAAGVPAQARGERAPALGEAPAGPARGARSPLQIEVVRADTREPLPGARVWCWPRSPALAPGGDFDEWLRSGCIEEHLASATETLSDASGQAELAAQPQGFVVAAECAGLWGCASFGALLSGPAQVALAPDVELRVQVLDAQGQPLAGAPVALRQRRGPACFERLLARTDAQGLAVLRHAGPFVHAPAAGEGELVVGLQQLFDPPLERRLDPDALPAEPIRLQLRAAGRCRVALVDAQGASVAGAFEARLSFDDAAAPAARHSESRRSRGSGEVLFEEVELGRALLAEVERECGGAPLQLRAAGPKQPGDEVELRLCVEQDSAILRGRVLDGAGAPVAARELRVCVEQAPELQDARPDWRVWTGSDGRFALVTAPRAGLPAEARLALLALGPDGAEEAVARLALPPELRAGSCELGDCVLRELPLAAAGTVLDDAGQPVAGARVGARLAQRALAYATTDEAGRFAIRGEAAGEELWLCAEKPGLCGAPMAVRAPAAELRLVLGRTGAIEGRVLLDPSLAQGLVLVQAECDAGTASAALGADGRFALPGLHPGTWTVRVVHAASASTLGSLAGLIVLAGASARDPRLDPLDLRGGARLIELEPVDELGRPVPQARAFSRESDEVEARWIAAEPAGARLRVFCDGRPRDVSIAAEGFFRVELERVRDSRRVTLQRGAELRLELAGGVPLPEPPLYVGVELTPLEPGLPGVFGAARQAFFGPDGVLRCSAGCAGTLRVRIVVARRGAGSAQLVHAGEALPSTLEVAPQSSLQVFQLRADAAALAAAIEAARGGG